MRRRPSPASGRTLPALAGCFPPSASSWTIGILGERPDKGQGAFFSAAAQVIPVLALALAIEATRFRQHLSRTTLWAAPLRWSQSFCWPTANSRPLKGSLTPKSDGNDAEIVWGLA